MKRYLFASDFDATLSFNDIGVVLSQIVGVSKEEFQSKVRALARLNLVQQGGELAYLLGHDACYRDLIRREHLLDAGRRIRLKEHVGEFFDFLRDAIEGFSFIPFTISAAPAELVREALKEMLPPNQIYGTAIEYDASGRIEAIGQVPAGFGKIAVLDGIQSEMGFAGDRIIYVGDGSSDPHVLLHVNRGDGFTISVSEARHAVKLARRTVLSENALSLLIPVLEQIAGWECQRIRDFFEAHGFVIQDWDKIRADWLTIRYAESTVKSSELIELSHA